MASQAPSATTGILHHIPPVSAFEVTTGTAAPNLLIWIGGLTDTYHSVAYVYSLAKQLPSDWTLAQVNLSSAAQGWGTASLSQDVNEISKIVAYFRSQRKCKIVVMGHSTGCQDCLHYLASEDKRGDRAKVDAVILQAPVSDREAMVKDMEKGEYDSANELAKQWIKDGKGEHVLPLNVTTGMFGRCPVTARRWVSLACPGGEDDYFSSDLGDDRLQATFGKVNVPLLILYGEKDEYVPDHVDRKALVGKWIKIVQANGVKVGDKSGELLGGASHNLNGDPEEVVDELIKRVNGFLASQ